jgi:hypothetical protein
VLEFVYRVKINVPNDVNQEEKAVSSIALL